MALRRYLLFSGEYHYPDGGWSDFRGSFDTIEAAMERQNKIDSEYNDYLASCWYHIVDIETAYPDELLPEDIEPPLENPADRPAGRPAASKPGLSTKVAASR